MRTIYNMNFDWDFHDGEIDFKTHHAPIAKSGNCPIARVDYKDEEVTWDRIQVPHDLRHYRCEYENDEALLNEGYLTTGIGWYRKEFFLDAEIESKSVFAEFDGVYRDSVVYVNGNFIGRHASGYTSFDYDISDFMLPGENNVIAVMVDGREFEGWWYEAVGIYRDVRLVITEPIHIKKDGVFVTSRVVGANAKVQMDVEVENCSERNGLFQLQTEVLDPKGSVIRTVTQEFTSQAYSDATVKVTFDIEEVLKWNLDETNQYQVVCSIVNEQVIIDTYQQKFGVREIEYSPEKGIILNGKKIKIQGVCVHDDFAGVGGAMSRSIIRHKIAVLKDLGCNGYRCSHNPPSPYLLEACDDYGILVMDEVRLMSSAGEYLSQMVDTIKRDRNHPSIFIWSIGNEEMAIHGTKIGVKVMKHMLRIANELDATRPCTYSNNCNWLEITDFNEKHGLSMEVLGLNYCCLRQFEMYEELHTKVPNRFMISTEIGSTLTTRGQYLPREEELSDDYYSDKATPITVWKNEARYKNVSEYAETYPTWGATPMETLKSTDADYVAGVFIWTGFDYRGEIFPFQWPSVVTRFGILDLCGFPKDVAHQYRVKWMQEPAIHVYPHWNFEKGVGTLEVQMVANTEEVELFVNGVSQGRNINPSREVVSYEVEYVAGEIIAVGYNKGEEVVSMSRKTALEPAKIKLEVLDDRKYIANGEDNLFIKVEVVDSEGNPCPTASNFIHFDVLGAGEFLGAGNGDPLSHADDKVPERYLFNGLALAILRTKREPGEIIFTATSEGLESASVVFEVTEVAKDKLVPVRDERVEIKAREIDDSEKYM
ncbi:MAG: glycoside hydrolase family 2 TIM barrel-domain containing protein [Lachnospiraceae bacterium]